MIKPPVDARQLCVIPAGIDRLHVCNFHSWAAQYNLLHIRGNQILVRKIDPALIRGTVWIEAEMKVERIPKPEKPFWGAKAMLVIEEAGGRKSYPEPAGIPHYGTTDWKICTLLLKMPEQVKSIQSCGWASRTVRETTGSGSSGSIRRCRGKIPPPGTKCPIPRQFPDTMEWGGELVERINRYLASGGRILLSGRSLLQAPFDLGAEIAAGPEEFTVSYLLPPKEFAPDFLTTPFVLYSGAVRLKVRRGISAGSVFDPYFERTLEHFCSHRQTPNRPEPSGWDAGVVSDSGAALACPVFREYRRNGQAVLRIHLAKIVDSLLGSRRIIRTTLPSVARVFVMDAPEENREIIHLLFAPIVKRGTGVEIIEDLTPLRNVEVEFSPLRPVKQVRPVPEGRGLPFESTPCGTIYFRVEEFTCHAMISLES